MTNQEQIIQNLILQIASLNRQLQAVQDQVGKLQNDLTATPGYVNPGGGSAATGVFVCYPSSNVSAATWSSHAPTSTYGTFSGTVWQVQEGSSPVNLGSFTIFNTLPVILTATYPCICLPDGAGNYLVISQSCGAA